MGFSKLKMDLERPEIRFALELIQKGSALARCVRAETVVHSILKTDRSPVTFADMGIQALAGALMEQYLPGAALVAEEDTDLFATAEGEESLEKITGYVQSFFPEAKAGKVSEWIGRGQGSPAASFWTLDPIDGTKGFLRGGQYALALAFIRNGKVELSAMGCPELQLEGYKALGKGVGILSVRGQGCWATSLEGLKGSGSWSRLEVSSCREIRSSRILDSFDPEHKNANKNKRIREVLEVSAEPILMDSMAKHAVIASGGAEIFLRTLSPKYSGHREKIWDVAAGALAIEEAGGRVTDLEGRELDFGTGLTLARNPGLVATNGVLHGAVLDALQKIPCV